MKVISRMQLDRYASKQHVALVRYHSLQPADELLASVSLLLLEVGDEVTAVLGVGDTSEGHGVSRSVVSGRLQVLIEGLVDPLALTGEGATMKEKDAESV